MPWFLRVILTMIISVQVEPVHSLSCQLARNHSSVLPEGYSRHNNRGWKPASQLLEQIRSLRLILYDSRSVLDRFMEAVLVSNRNHPLPARIIPRLVSGNKQGPKLLRRHSDSRPNTHVSRRQLVEDYRNRNLHNGRSLINPPKIDTRRLPTNIDTRRDILASVNTIPGGTNNF